LRQFKYIFLLLSFVLVGCNEYTTQICKESLRVDVPGFEGTHKFTYQDPEFNVDSQDITFMRTATGVYENSEGAMIYTCESGGKLIAESMVKGSTNFETNIIEKTPSGLEVAFAIFDRAALDRDHISYEIVERESNTRAEKEKYKVLVVDNAAMQDPSSIAQYLIATSAVIKLY
jgi:hypothetical protein